MKFKFVPENFRSHKKYYYVFREYPDHKVITVDDDLIYPGIRLSVCFLCHISIRTRFAEMLSGKFVWMGNTFSVYRKWPKVFMMPVNSSLQNVAIGCGEFIILPVGMERSCSTGK